MFVCRYLSVMRGWWLSWASPEPRRSGAFIVEVVERAVRTRTLGGSTNGHPRGRWPTISLGTAGAVGPAGLEALEAIGAINTDYTSNEQRDRSLSYTSSFAPASPKSQVTTARDARENTLYEGDSFRLRSVKFPEFELGITSEHLKANFSYLGLRKVCVRVILPYIVYGLTIAAYYV